jgi:ribosomal protein S18 acetylase RimI-like enzyme
MRVRAGTEADEAVLRELWQEFVAEVPEPAGFEPDTWDEDWSCFRRDMGTNGFYVAEDDDGVLGLAHAEAIEPGRWHVETVYVRPRARRRGVATALLRELVSAARAAGATHVSLDVLASNDVARTVWRRLGFEDVEHLMTARVDTLDSRLADIPEGESRASTHVQSDDTTSVERALAQFVPRLEAPDVTVSDGGWIRIADPLLDDDREAQSRLARELSHRLGAVVVALALEHGAVVRFRLYEHGRMVDEYLSVPTFYGALPKGDELALDANPTLVARLTGASRDDVRHAARTAGSPGELPPGPELYEQIARVMRLEP